MASKQFDWSQDATSLNISIPISGVSLKKIDVFMTDLSLKVNVKANNYLKIFDFPHEIDYKSRENKVRYDDGTLELYIKKAEPLEWSGLTVQGLSKDEIRKRRDESFKRREEAETQLQSQRNDLKIKFDRLATEEQMRLESLERNTIDERKQREKEAAEEELYSQLDEKAQFKHTKQEHHKQLEEIEDDEDLEEEEDIPASKGKQVAAKKPTQDGDIFSSENVPYLDDGEEVPQEKVVAKPAQVLAEPRKAGSVPIKFTEKMYPHLAAREQHLKEPPLPKTTQIQKTSEKDDTENPLWLKDKADEFYRNGDYFSAINAYSSAYRKKNDFIECLTNRSCCFLRLFDYENCISDSDQILEFLDKQTEKTDKHRILRLKTVVRKAVALSWKGCLDEARTVLQNQLNSTNEGETMTEDERKITLDYLQLVETRFRLNELKRKADIELGKANIEEAKSIYEEILKEDSHHEIVRANLSLAYLKLKDYEKTVSHCDEVLNHLKTFKSTSQIDVSQGRSWWEFRTFVVKVLLRRSSALENLERYYEAVKDVDQALLFQNENAEAKKAQHKLRSLLNRKEIENIKEEANRLLKEKKIDEALEKYDQCLKKIQPTDLVPYLGILLNKCTCFLFLSKFEEIVSISLRGLNLISNHKQKVISFADVSERKELNEKLKDYEIRFLVRRGNAYLKTKKFYHAKSDLEDALKLDPQNAQIKQDLQSLNDAIAEK